MNIDIIQYVGYYAHRDTVRISGWMMDEQNYFVLTIVRELDVSIILHASALGCRLNGDGMKSVLPASMWRRCDAVRSPLATGPLALLFLLLGLRPQPADGEAVTSCPGTSGVEAGQISHISVR